MKNTACRLKIVKFVAFLKAFEKTFLRSFLQHSRYFLHWKNIFLPSLSSLLQCITDYSAESLVVMPFHPDGHLSLPFQYCSFSMYKIRKISVKKTCTWWGLCPGTANRDYQITDFWLEISKNDNNIIWTSIKNTWF